uniref:VWFD domain-containing protein n=1 Tax=Biomphalaria glabrata TaxID=6526 RepID=A0A2C9M586_BIOGL
MKWSFVRNRKILMGYVNSDGVVDLGFTNTAVTTRLDTLIGAAGNPGVFIFKVGESESQDYKCLQFYNSNVARAQSIEFKNDLKQLPACPCSEERVRKQWQFVFKRGTNDNIFCYAISSIQKKRKFAGNSLNKLCCYIRLNPFFYGFYLSGNAESGHILTSNPFQNFSMTIAEDVYPKSLCCQGLTKKYCDLFNQVRPDMGCSLASGFVTASFFGDPHLTALDGLQYTMNGWGEYILIDSEDFRLQGRTDRIEATNGTLINATVFVAFAAKERNDATLQVELSANKTSMVIFANGIDLTNEFYASEGLVKDMSTFIVSRETIANKTNIVAKFTSITINIFMGIKCLEVNIEAGVELKGNITGLLGNFNGNVSDDFVLPDGTVLAPNETNTERKIFENFGRKWVVTSNNSIFAYGAYKSSANYSHQEFVPLFLDEVSESERNASIAKCGDNVACQYDYLATRDEKFAENTKDTFTSSQSAKISAANNLPTFNITEGLNIEGQWELSSGHQQTLTVQLNDSDGDYVTLKLIGGPFSDVQIYNNSALTYLPNENVPITIKLMAEDSKNGTSSVITVPITLCPNCSGNGICDKKNKQTDKSTYNFDVYACQCFPAYTGWLQIFNLSFSLTSASL